MWPNRTLLQNLIDKQVPLHVSFRIQIRTFGSLLVADELTGIHERAAEWYGSGQWRRCSGEYSYVPGEEERLVELVEDVDDEVVVGDGLDLRPRELVVDQDPLQHKHKPIPFTTAPAGSFFAACGGRRPGSDTVREINRRRQRTTSVVM